MKVAEKDRLILNPRRDLAPFQRRLRYTVLAVHNAGIRVREDGGSVHFVKSREVAKVFAPAPRKL